jgi:DNA helicase IV
VRLPAYQDLSKEQEAINNLPLDGSYLVTGPPGSGKTVIALYRAQMIEKRGRLAQILMFNGLLVRYTTAALDDLEVDAEAKTYLTWLYKTCSRSYRAPVVNISDFHPDWDLVAATLRSQGDRALVESDLIIDEGQDLPPRFYEAARLMAKNITVCADENQTIHEESSTFEQIRETLGEEHRVLRLSKNHRNTLQVAEVARCFYTDENVGRAELPDRVGPKPQVRETESLEQVIELIRTYEANNDGQEIGVFVADDDLRRAMADALEGTTTNEVHTYFGNQVSDDMSMGTPGVRIMCSESAKGLEFDTVFVLDAQSFAQRLRDATTLKRRFYVMTSRARDNLYILWSGTTEPAILKIVPDELADRRKVSK